MLSFLRMLQALLLTTATPGHGPASIAADTGVRSILPRYEAALTDLLHGDAAAWLRLTSDAADVTLIDAEGGIVTGQAPVRAAYRRISAGHRPADTALSVEYVATGASGDLAYVAAVERLEPGSAAPAAAGDSHTRATMLFRREGGEWRLVHRQMDHLRDTMPVEWGPSVAITPSPGTADLDTFLAAFESALRAMLNGDATAWLALVSRDPTLFTPNGGVRIGREAVLRRYAFAAPLHQPSGATVRLERLRLDVAGDVAVAAWLEHSTVRLTGRDGLRPSSTRTTHVFLREDGQWRLAHRHMNHLGEAATPRP
jgi:uncharacterized protein (TIGR02246 family)